MVNGQQRARRPECGFTLIEVMAALIIFAIAVVGLTATSISVIRANHVSRDVTAASALATDKIEEFRALAMPDDTARMVGGTDEVDAAGNAGGKFTRTWTINDGPTPGMARIDVTVAWETLVEREITVSGFVCRFRTC